MRRRQPVRPVISLTVLLALVATACTQGPTDTTPADSGTTAETTGEVQTTVITETSTAETTAPTETTPATETTATAAAELTFGMILVGPQNDHGWSQAHYEAGQYVEEQLGAEDDRRSTRSTRPIVPTPRSSRWWTTWSPRAPS